MTATKTPGKPKRKSRRAQTATRLARPMRIGRLLPKEVVAIYRRRGFLHHEIIARWPLIVGEQLARVTVPLAIRHSGARHQMGVLELKVAPGFAPAVQHEQKRLLAAVNRYFGHQAVTRLAIRQGPVRAAVSPPSRTDPKPSAQARQRANRLARHVTDPQLSALLARWGALVLDKPPR